jgi:hypothetical protein
VCLPTQGPNGLLEKPYLKVPAAAVSETSSAGSVAGQAAANITAVGKVSALVDGLYREGVQLVVVRTLLR